jgi:hypothetical protein
MTEKTSVIRLIILLEAGLFALVVILFGDMLRDGCFIDHAGFLYGIFLSLLLVAGSLLAATGSSVFHRHFSALLLAASLIFFAWGGFGFIHHFTHNRVIDCGYDWLGGDSSPTPVNAGRV